ncbi:MAG: penicillin-insensitive murein endopeptidase, partial [Mesorhizobium sp.]
TYNGSAVPVAVAAPEPEAPSLPATTASSTEGLPSALNAFTATPEVGVPVPRPRPPGN